MLSVIIPTMWKFEPFKQFVSDLSLLECVGEILVIDNDKISTPESIDFFWSNSKIKRIVCENNIYVNPAWNLGVLYSKFENVCIINDDVIVDFKAFLKIDKFLTETPNVGLVGVSPGQTTIGQSTFQNGTIEIIPWIAPSETNTHGNYFGIGTLFFLKRENWIKIPDEMKVYFGDDWVFQTQLINKRINFLFQNVFYYTPSAATCTTIFDDAQRAEIYNADMILYNHYLTRNFYVI